MVSIALPVNTNHDGVYASAFLHGVDLVRLDVTKQKAKQRNLFEGFVLNLGVGLSRSETQASAQYVAALRSLMADLSVVVVVASGNNVGERSHCDYGARC